MAPPKKTAPEVEYKEFPGVIANAEHATIGADAKREPHPGEALRKHQIAMEANFPQLFKPDRFHQKESNLPKKTPQSLALDAQNAAHAADLAARQVAHRAEDKRKWCKIGLQPSAQGFILHVEQYEGDTKVKETVWKKLSPLAARERLALHMSALWSGF